MEVGMLLFGLKTTEIVDFFLVFPVSPCCGDRSQEPGY